MRAAYDRALQRNPLLVKSLTSAVLFGAGDLMCQKLEGKKSIEVERAARMTAWGGLFAVVAHPWYTGLDKVVKATGTAGTVQKLLADQLVWAPPINAFFFWTLSMMEDGDNARAVAGVKEKLWPTLKVNWVVGPVLQGINFAFVPGPYRILYINVCTLFWSVFLSNMANTRGGDGAGASSSATGGSDGVAGAGASVKTDGSAVATLATESARA